LGWHETNFQNRYTGTGSLEKIWSNIGLSSELSSTLYGPQKLPEGRTRSVSPSYVLVDWRIAKSLGAFEIGASVKNLTDWTQPDNPYYYNPSTGKRGIDSGLYYGPLLGRTFFVSLTYSIGNNKSGEN
jgi:outer membrane receptor protein involved in Fe transport